MRKIMLSCLIAILPVFINGCTNPSKEEEIIESPEKIELGEVTQVGKGYKISCAFMESISYIRVKGKLKVEVFNWEMSDNVQYRDPDTYDLGTKLCEASYTVKPEDCVYGDIKIAYKFTQTIESEAKPNKTYLSARFTFTPDADTSKNIIGGSDYQTL
ncbi:MAG: hypothetical protein O3B82_00970 [Bacteroidetes bacterium]|nr:hypothetical protein [Bacteroidota bacterium]